MNKLSIKKNTSFDPILTWAGVFIIIAGIKAGSFLFTPILLAIFISIIGMQPVSYLQKKKISKAISIAIVLILIIGLLSFFGVILGNSISRFTQNIPQLNDKFNILVLESIEQLNNFGFTIPKDELLQSIDPGKILGFTASTLNGMGSFMGQTFFIALLAFFMMLEMDSFPLKIRAIAKENNNKNATTSEFDLIISNVRNYLAIKTLTSFTTGLLIFIGLKILGLDYAYLWGLIAFLLNYIPQIGSLLAAIPAMIFAAIQLNYTGVFWTGIIFLVVNVFIGSFIEPRIMGKGMGLSTLVVLISLVFWGWVLGPIGMFLSVPLTMVLKIALESSNKSHWLAIILGTKQDALDVLKPTSNENSSEK